LNIYIYGNHSFKEEIHETLEHSNIKFKLDDNSIIKEIDTLFELKKTIKENPKDIYLIDDEKIIKKNSLNKKIKFFAPKDGIEEEFLLDSGIADVSINSLSEIPKYILRKHDEEKLQNDSSIQDSIVNIVDEAYEKETKESSESIELDDELSKLLAKEENINESINNKDENDDLDDLFDMHMDINLDDSDDILSINKEEDNISKEELDDIMNFNDNFGLNNISFDYDDKGIENEFGDKNEFDNDLESEDNEIFENIDFLEDVFSEKIKKEDKKESLDDNEIINKSLQGEKSMNDDKFFELDSLNEDDLLDALNCTDNRKNNTKQEVSQKNDLVENNSNSINITNSSNTDELAQLISKLLSNKTLEITIKIKD
jgi:hypothetical protein